MRCIVLLVSIFIVTPAVPGEAQESGEPFASAFLPADHWAIDAARRLDALGLIPSGYDRVARPLPRRTVARALEEAVRVAAANAPAYEPLARAYLERYAEEFPATMIAVRGEEMAGPRLGDGAVSAGYERHRGRLVPGVGYDNGEDWTGPATRDDVSSPVGGAEWSAQLFPYLAASVHPVRRAEEWRLTDGYVTGVWRSIGVWLGRRAIGFAPARSGGIVLNAAAPFDGGGVYLPEPVELPGFLRHLGPFVFETFLTRTDESGPVERPWVWAARMAVEPHPRLTIGISRAAMFGGEGENGLSLRNLAFLMIGKHAGAGSGFDNHVVAVDVWFSPPVRVLPLALYLEWGIEDSAGALIDTPGIVAGLTVPAVPGLPELALGIERTSFSRSCCGNPIWYRHWRFDDGWTKGDTPLGHPLGGHGTEWLAYGQADVMQARLRLDVRAFARDRGEENLFAPDREGNSTGGALGASFRATPRLDAILDLSAESGDGWTETRALAGVRLMF